VTRRVLEADDTRQLGEAEKRVARNRRCGARGDVVKQDRQLDHIVKRAEMSIDAFLRRADVVGRRGEDAVGASVRRVFRKLYGWRGGGGAYARDYRHAIIGDLH